MSPEDAAALREMNLYLFRRMCLTSSPILTPRQADQKWVDDTRAEYLRRTEPKPAPRLGLYAEVKRFLAGQEARG